MKTPKPTDKGIVVYRKYTSFTTHEYITVFRGKVISSVNPLNGKCVDEGIRLYTKKDLEQITRIILAPINEFMVFDLERHYLNGTNYKLAESLLR